MVDKLSRRDALKLGAVGLGGGLLAASPFAKKKKENNMTIQIDSFSNSGYQPGQSFFSWEHAASPILNLPGLVVGVSMFESATVLSVTTAEVSLPQSFTFVRGETNGNFRSEIWCLQNFTPQEVFIIEVLLSAAVNAAAGSSLYQYFGGIGVQDGTTGTGLPQEVIVDTSQVNSIVFANACGSSAGGAGIPARNERWNILNGSNYGIGADTSPFEQISSVPMNFDNDDAGDWALSVVELVNYQDNPPAITGM